MSIDPNDYHMSPVPPGNGEVNSGTLVLAVVIVVVVVLFGAYLFYQSWKTRKKPKLFQ